jgi:hypothetical protein
MLSDHGLHRMAECRSTTCNISWQSRTGRQPGQWDRQLVCIKYEWSRGIVCPETQTQYTLYCVADVYLVACASNRTQGKQQGAVSSGASPPRGPTRESVLFWYLISTCRRNWYLISTCRKNCCVSKKGLLHGCGSQGRETQVQLFY